MQFKIYGSNGDGGTGASFRLDAENKAEASRKARDLGIQVSAIELDPVVYRSATHYAPESHEAKSHARANRLLEVVAVFILLSVPVIVVVVMNVMKTRQIEEETRQAALQANERTNAEIERRMTPKEREQFEQWRARQVEKALQSNP